MKDLSYRQIQAISSLVYENFGIFITPDKFFRFKPKLDKLIHNENYSGPEEFYDCLMTGDIECLNMLVTYITTGHTFFFREPEHFRQLVVFLREHPQSNCRIWCAACSTGEEPYSIIMTLLDEGIHNFHIVASDINKKVLDHFNRGVYHESRLSQMSSVSRLKYFTRKRESWYEIKHQLRNYVSIKDINLMNPVSFPEKFDYIFCRNVLIYFNEQSRKKAIDNLINNLKVGGIFFIGHAEALLQQPENLKKIGSSVYRRTS
ncbi:MAG: protein-glutamate O-methyltransferase CheR [Treponema sp.]|jgi:chemotaxis protein methyltransferase CheR|nr:protein-glutamate O-methyltransferase CheR [Treponema sp.]